MQSPKIFFPTIVATSIYLSILIIILYYKNISLQNNFLRYSSQKDNFIELSIVENIAPKPKSKLEKKSDDKIEEEKTIQASKNEQIAENSSNKPEVDIDSLFARPSQKQEKNIPDFADIKAQKSPMKNAKPTKNSTQKSMNATNILSSLNLSKSPEFASSSVGIYDKFRGRVQEILDSYWKNTIATNDGNEAKVEVFIDSFGTFSYNIVNLSYNQEFNDKLKAFLAQMEDIRFPKNSDNLPSMIIIFKDKE